MERRRRHQNNLLDRHIIKRRDFTSTPEKQRKKFSNAAINILGSDFEQPSTAPAKETRNREAYARLIEDRLKAIEFPAIPVIKTKQHIDYSEG